MNQNLIMHHISREGFETSPPKNVLNPASLLRTFQRRPSTSENAWEMLKYICKRLRGVQVLLRTLVTRQSTSASVREAPKYFWERSWDVEVHLRTSERPPSTSENARETSKYICERPRGVDVLLKTLERRQSTSENIRKASKYFWERSRDLKVHLREPILWRNSIFDCRQPSWILRKMNNSSTGLFLESSSMSMPNIV